MRVLIKNGHVLDPATGVDGICDVLTEDQRIIGVKEHIEEQADRVIDAKGCYVMPGFIDLHVHLRDPGLEYKETLETGGKAAAHGGVTTVCAMPNTKPVIDTKERVEDVHTRAKEDSPVHVIQLGAVTVGQAGEELADIEGMAEAGCHAISEDGKSVMNASLYREGMRRAAASGIAVFAHCEDIHMVEGGVMNADQKAEDGKSVMNASLYREGMRRAAASGIAVFAHCEDIHMVEGGVMNADQKAEALGLKGITNAVEDVIVARDILLAKETGVQLHLCHCSTADSVRMVAEAKKDGLPVTAEVCPHHFIMTTDDITEDDGNFKMAIVRLRTVCVWSLRQRKLDSQ